MNVGASANEYVGCGRLQGKVAIVTGAATGIGRSIAVAFAKEGAKRVVCCYYDEHEEAKKTIEEIAACGKHAMALCGDICNEEFARDAVDKVMEAYGQPIDVLVNNAGGQMATCSSLKELTEKKLFRTFGCNVFGTMWMCKHVLPHMANDGAIVNHSSCAAYTGREDLLDYAAAQGALLSFTHSLAANEECVRKRIRVNCVASGNVMTPNVEKTLGRDVCTKVAKEECILGRCAHPDEVAPSFVFLASRRDSGFMTGHVLHPDGGVRIGC